MSYFTQEIEDFALSLPITQTAQHIAQQFANEQPTPQKAEQVRLNTLAVYVMNDYLQMMGVPTNLEASDSWNPVLRLCADVADLEVTGVGRLECRPYHPSQPTCYVPPEVWSDRLGYVVVQIDEQAHEATVLGFTQQVATEDIPLRQLKPIDDLFECLYSAPEQTIRFNLSQWFTDIVEQGWETVESLLNPPPELAYGFRSRSDSAIADSILGEGSTRRAKVIDLGMQLGGYAVALVVEIKPNSEQKVDIVLQVRPVGNQLYLPPLLQLIVLDENGLIFLDAQARTADNYIQLQFSGLPGEQFSVKVSLGDASVTEDFTI